MCTLARSMCQLTTVDINDIAAINTKQKKCPIYEFNNVTNGDIFQFSN